MNDNPEKQRIVLIDDHPMIREHIGRVINKEPDMEVVGESDNIQDALEVIQKSHPHLAVVDLSLVEENGLDIVTTLKVLSIPVPVLVFTMHDDSLRVERAFRAGVKGYVTKHQPSHVIITAIRRVLAGKMYLSEDMIDTVLSKLVPGGTRDTLKLVERLSHKELAILGLIATGQPSSAIAEALSISMGTLSTHKRRIKIKLNLHKHSELTHFAIEWRRELERRQPRAGRVDNGPGGE